MAAFSEENQNFFRLYYVLNQFGTEALNEVLRHVVYQTFPPAMTLSVFLALHQVQNELCPVRTRSCLDPMQRELLYPSGVPSTTLDYGDLDITLVTTLLKNLTVFSGIFKQPGSCSSTLWANPTEHDQLFYPIEANVVLLKNKRKVMAHSQKPSLPTIVFQADFEEVKTSVMNIIRLVGSAAFNEDDIEQYRKCPLSPELFKETALMLLESLEMAKGIKDEVRRLREKQSLIEGRLLEQIKILTRRISRMMIMIVWLIISNIASFVLLVGISGRELWHQVKGMVERVKKWLRDMIKGRDKRARLQC